ncbi:MAG: hypothetical protein HUN04_12385 [Desulfobacter sp.]|nr:MAG: hypothetical protein HUN04_12385 [Desulfobacter sp.]
MKLLAKWSVGVLFVFTAITTAIAQGGGITIDANGNTGIGTETPSAPLDVNGNTKITGSLTVSGDVEAPRVKVTNAPVENTDAVNKSYVDPSIASLQAQISQLQAQVNTLSNGTLGLMTNNGNSCPSGYVLLSASSCTNGLKICVKPGYGKSFFTNCAGGK